MGIYVVSHKEIMRKFPVGYNTIIVNANVNKIDGDFYDNTGDNITDKNESYCELTAMYWIWKNKKDKFVGINHYRRFFVDDDKELLSIKTVEKVISSNKVIVPKKEKFKVTIGTKYWTTSGYKSDLSVIRDAIIEYSPEYVDDYDSFMNQNKMYCYNMLIMNNKMYNEYCKWLFGVMEIIENNLDSQGRGVKSRKGYYKRIYGFIAERLFNVYIKHNNIETIEYAVEFTEKRDKFSRKLINKMNKIKDKYI